MRILYKLLLMTFIFLSVAIGVISYVIITYGLGNIFYISSAALILICGGLAFFVAKTITKPAKYLIKESTEIARGVLNFNEELEKRVQERTAELVEANVRIKRLLDVKTQFVNQVSHDLRTPLTPLLTLLPIMKDEMAAIKDKKLKKDLDEMMIRVIGNAEYLSSIVTSTLSISRLDTGKLKLELKADSLHDIVVEVIVSHKELFEEKHVKILNTVKADLPKVNVDKMRMRELFDNLITNSVKFMEGKEKLLSFDSYIYSDKFLIISVKDNGVGIEEKHLKKVFEEFFKADPSRHVHSSGLGLSICKRIVEIHGGKIWAESPGVGKGTTFKFALPIYTQ